MHCFDGKAKDALRAIKSNPNIYFSIPPSIVRDTGMQKLLTLVPLDNLLLESDSPALAPVQNERNVPANVATSISIISSLKGITNEIAILSLHQNTLKCFPKLQCKLQNTD